MLDAASIPLSTWFAGLLALLPLALTAAVLAWVLNLIYSIWAGQPYWLAVRGARLSLSAIRYSLMYSTLVLVAAIYLLGVVVRMGLKGPIKNLTDRTLRHFRLWAGHSLADRFVGLLDQKQEST
jgi:uncharacterized membrane protein